MKRSCFFLLTVFVCFVMMQAETSDACTAFCLVKPGKYVILGKNLDWPIGTGFIVLNKKGEAKTSLINPGETAVSWVAEYGSVSFNMFGKDFPLGGMNEAGLVIEELSFSPSVYPKLPHKASLTEMQWIQYQLDMYATVADVIENVSNLQISKFITGLHYVVCDRTGRRAVIEFLQGKTVIYSDDNFPVPVLSNNTYANSLKYIKLHKGFGGSRIVGNGPESPERFVRAATLIQKFESVSSGPPADYAFSILDTVKQADTQWSIVYNSLALEIYFCTKDAGKIKTIKLKNCDFASHRDQPCQLKVDGLTQGSLLNIHTVTTADRNLVYLKQLFEKMVELDILERESAQLMNKRLINYLRGEGK